MIKNFLNKNIYKLLWVLFCIFVLSTFLLPRLGAKYLSSGNAKDVARTSVYYFDISSQLMTFDASELNFDPTCTLDSGNEKTIKVNVKGTSEAAVYINANVKLMGNLPLAVGNATYTFNGSDTSYLTNGSSLLEDNTLTCGSETCVVRLLPTDAIRIEPNTSLNNDILAFSFDVAWTSDTSKDFASYIYENGVEYIEVEVTTKQID